MLERLFAAVQSQAEADGQIDWTGHDVDDIIVRAPQHAAGATKGARRAKREGGAGVDSAPKCICARQVVASS
jgi:hypothetical protein